MSGHLFAYLIERMQDEEFETEEQAWQWVRYRLRAWATDFTEHVTAPVAIQQSQSPIKPRIGTKAQREWRRASHSGESRLVRVDTLKADDGAVCGHSVPLDPDLTGHDAALDLVGFEMLSAPEQDKLKAVARLIDHYPEKEIWRQAGEITGKRNRTISEHKKSIKQKLGKEIRK